MIPQLRFPQFTDEWQAKRLGDVVEFKNGKPFEDYVSKDGEYHLITIDSVDIEGNLKSKFKKVTKSDNSLQKNDIVTVLSDIAHGNLLGLTSLIPADRQFVLNQRMGRLRPKDGSSARFISHYINTKQAYYRKRGQGTSQRHIYERDINQMIVNMPMAKEQEKIAEFLTAVDGRIGKIEKKLELLQRYKKGVMQKIFTQQIRFKDENGNPYPEWEERRLGNIGTLHRGLSYNKSNVKDDESLNLVMRSNNIQDGHLDYGNDLQFVDKGVTADLILIKGDIAICMANGSRRLVGKSAVYDGGYKVGHILTVGAFCSIFRSRNVLAKFLFQTDTYKKGIDLLLAGTNINNLKNSDLASIRFSIPSEYEEQQKIASFLTALDNRIKAEQTRLTAAKQWKKGLLQRMFT